MIDLGNRQILDDGTVICQQAALIDLLYADVPVSNVFCNDIQDADEWTTAARDCDDAVDGPVYAQDKMYGDIIWRDHWMTPEPYRSIDLDEWCHQRCTSETEHQRVQLELDEMKTRGMYPVILHIIYCVDIWRNNGVFWGVGRGSSVCSFVLYLTGINRINPLDYGLDIKEWLK